MIKRWHYFLSAFIISIIISLLMSFRSRNFTLDFLFYTAVVFIIVVSITIFPYTYYNHLSELRILNTIQKYPPESIVNIFDARARFNVSIHDEDFEIIPGLTQEEYVDAKAVFLGHYLEFYQYSSPWVLSYFPFLKIDLTYVTDISQGKHKYPITTPDLPLLIKCNYFQLITRIQSYKMIVQQESTDKFICAILTGKTDNQNI